jgi:hypothetical protein
MSGISYYLHDGYPGYINLIVYINKSPGTQYLYEVTDKGNGRLYITLTSRLDDIAYVLSLSKSIKSEEFYNKLPAPYHDIINQWIQ